MSLPDHRLGGLQLDDEVCEALASTLEANNTLTLVSLGQNKITSRGARSLARALAVNTSLETLK